MCKNKLAIVTSLIVLGLILNCFCLMIYRDILNTRQSELETSSKMQQIARECKQIACYKTHERLFSCADIKEELKRILLESHVEKVKIKRLARDIIEIKFQSDVESSIYNCVDNLYTQMPGIVSFDSIKIGLLNGKIAAICKMKLYCPNIDSNYLAIDELNRPKTHVSLFTPHSMYKLMGIVKDQNACVNNKWYQLGELIDEFQIIKIHHSYIEVKQGETKLIIPVGGVW